MNPVGLVDNAFKNENEIFHLAEKTTLDIEAKQLKKVTADLEHIIKQNAIENRKILQNIDMLEIKINALQGCIAQTEMIDPMELHAKKLEFCCSGSALKSNLYQLRSEQVARIVKTEREKVALLAKQQDNQQLKGELQNSLRLKQLEFTNVQNLDQILTEKQKLVEELHTLVHENFEQQVDTNAALENEQISNQQKLNTLLVEMTQLEKSKVDGTIELDRVSKSLEEVKDKIRLQEEIKQLESEKRIVDEQISFNQLQNEQHKLLLADINNLNDMLRQQEAEYISLNEENAAITTENNLKMDQLRSEISELRNTISKYQVDILERQTIFEEQKASVEQQILIITNKHTHIMPGIEKAKKYKVKLLQNYTKLKRSGVS